MDIFWKLCVTSPRAAPPYCPPKGPLSVIHADAHLIAIDKPSGLLSVPGRGPEKADCAITRVQALYPDALTVHRLDMDTSGLLLFARGKEAQRALSIQFEKGQVDKRYIADVWGTPTPASGLIDLPLITDWPNRPRQKVDHEIGKPSQTEYEVNGAHPSGTRVTLKPLTGRSHQLRVHMAELSCPILGDDLYAHQQALNAAPRLCLHAAHLSLTHPDTGKRLDLTVPCPF